VIGHPPDALFEEMAELAGRFHWSRDQLMSLTHHERRRWLRELERAGEDTAWP
jgi:hypothetical protein